jgi:hypothetical protein
MQSPHRSPSHPLSIVPPTHRTMQEELVEQVELPSRMLRVRTSRDCAPPELPGDARAGDCECRASRGCAPQV